jgi:LmbE family N-acetylglucosaminyl deacetylase
VSGRERRPAPADPIQAPGTPESAWRAWDGWERLPDAELPADGHVVVVAAHPDDEVLGVGGTLALLAEAGVRITVVTVTDGERSHPTASGVRPDRLAGLRAAELRAALTELGVLPAAIHRLRAPDTGVAGEEARVAAALRELLPGAALCLAPWTGDVHADHEAAGRAALAAARETGVRCATYPVWMWHWARPGDPAVPWGSATRVRLPAAAAARKRAAADRFATQVRPIGPGEGDAAILPPEELAHHLRDVEVLFS